MTFQHALLRRPAPSLVKGITTANLGIPNFDLALQQHEIYQRALQSAGVETTLLPALPAFPDAVFIEDAAVLAGHCAILARPGAETRRGEASELAPDLALRFAHFEQIHAPGTLDGGDICEVDGHFLIGLSARTNLAGAEQLALYLKRHEFSNQLIDMRAFAAGLHLKSALNYLGDGIFLVDERLKALPELVGRRVISVPVSEAYAANCLRVNDCVLVPEGFPQTLTAIDAAGIKTIVVDVSEYRKLDGGLSCLSLRW